MPSVCYNYRIKQIGELVRSGLRGSWSSDPPNLLG